MAENIIIDKVIGESGASNSNEIDQSKTTESKVSKGREKRSRAWDHFTRKTNSDGTERLFVSIVRKSILLTQKNMVQRQCLLIKTNAQICLIILILTNQD